MNGLVIGESGLVGTKIYDCCQSRGYEITGTTHSTSLPRALQADKRDKERVQEVVEETNPDVVYDTAAFHAVDNCETERKKAFDVNARGTYNVACAADAVDAHYVYVSTDYVFPGYPDETPYGEDDPVAPCNYYAQTKYAGEQAAKVADDWTVLRSSVIYGLASDNFITWALSELRAENELRIVDDQISRPTYAPDLAEACVDAAEAGLTGIYHATGPESLSRYEFTVRLAEEYGYDPDLVSPISTEEFGQEARRPADSSLDSTRLYEALNREFRRPADGFAAMCDQR